LYPSGPLKCQSCQLSDDSSKHISLCPSHHVQLPQILIQHKSLLIELLEEHSTTLTFDLHNRINQSPLFDLPYITGGDNNNSLHITHPSLLLIYNLIPTKLSAFFYTYIGRSSTRDKCMIQFLLALQKSLNEITWNSHQRDLKNWEKTLNITKRKKRFYKRLKSTRTRRRTNPASNNIYDATRFSPYYKSHSHLDIRPI
jgi:hypothetical protein